MNKQFLLISITLIFNISTIYGQNCNCESNFIWVKNTFENNDAGFKYALDTKGKSAYDFHNKEYLQKIKKIKNSAECQKTISEWLTFFRRGHIGLIPIFDTNPKSNNSNNKPTNPKWETVNIDISEFEKLTGTFSEANIEGIWTTDPYIIGIKKFADEYKGFIIKSGAENWKEKEVKIRLSLDKQKGQFYRRDKSSQEFSNAELIGKNHLKLGAYHLKRVSPKFEENKNIETHFRIIEAEKPLVEQINATTILLRIPSFHESQKAIIDSVVNANKEKILHTENLIIDIRNNGGGSDVSYSTIIPFLYTNPIRIVGVEMLSTKLNNQRMLKIIEMPEFDDETKKWAKTAYDTLETKLGQFVNLEDELITIKKLDTIYPMPQNVGIIINKENGSTAEQFLLAAKQSKKVKLFGTTTFGVLDISNMHFVKSPCNEFELGYSLSKSFRIPDMSIDSKGIQPDYYIDNEIKEYEWIDYVNNILNQK